MYELDTPLRTVSDVPDSFPGRPARAPRPGLYIYIYIYMEIYIYIYVFVCMYVICTVSTIYSRFS